MHRTTTLLFWERCVPSVGRLRHQSVVTATVHERSQRTDGVVPLRSTAFSALGPHRSYIQESNAVPLFEATVVSKVALQLR